MVVLPTDKIDNLQLKWGNLVQLLQGEFPLEKKTVAVYGIFAIICLLNKLTGKAGATGTPKQAHRLYQIHNTTNLGDSLRSREGLIFQNNSFICIC